MKFQHEQLLKTLVEEKRFPITFKNSTKEERELMVEITEQYNEQEIMNTMLQYKTGGLNDYRICL